MFFFVFLGLHLGHMEVPRLGVEPELRLPATATTTATAMLDPKLVYNLTIAHGNTGSLTH